MLAAASRQQTDDSDSALATLCRDYWYPLYAYIRSRGYSAADAQDLTQEFFALLLEKHFLREANPERGRFRSFLLAAVGHFLSNQQDRQRAQKRGGGTTVVSLELGDAEGRYIAEPSHSITPEKIFERSWTLTLLDRVLAQMEKEYARTGKASLFAGLKRYLTGAENLVPYGIMAADLNMTEAAVKVAVHRLRRRFRDLLREQVAETVANAEEIDPEIRHLLSTLSP